MFICDFCGDKFVNEKLLHSHLHLLHKHDSGFYVRCNVNDCPNTFSNFNSLYVHRHRKHKNIPDIPKYAAYAINTESNETDSSSDIPIPENKSDENETLLAKFILNLRASTNVSNAKLQEILCQMQELIENSVRCTLNYVNNILITENSQVHLSSIINFEEVINNEVMPFKKLNTIYKQDNFFSTQFHVTAPKTIDLSRDIIPCSRDELNNRQYKINDIYSFKRNHSKFVNKQIHNRDDGSK